MYIFFSFFGHYHRLKDKGQTGKTKLNERIKWCWRQLNKTHFDMCSVIFPHLTLHPHLVSQDSIAASHASTPAPRRIKTKSLEQQTSLQILLYP